MNTRVIALARQVGTAGEEVAQEIARRLEFRYVDYQVIQDAAHEAGVSAETVSEAEHTPSLLTRVLESLARNPSMPSAGWADPIPLTTSPLFTSADYRNFVADVIRDLAQAGECVIVGHAAQVILRDRVDTFRVLVTGSAKYRAARVTTGMAVDEKTAFRTIERTDNERLDYFRRFFDTNWLLPANYDLCINTDRLTPANAVDLVVSAATLR